MIKANELRVGNYYSHNGEIRQVTVNVIESVWESERTWCQPTPLTPEILGKCGFYAVSDAYFKTSDDRFNFEWSQYKDGEWCISFMINSGSGWSTLYHVKYLHQLQNLYFALTGEELNINL